MRQAANAMNAHRHFNDPEWDGEPVEPEPKEQGKPGNEHTPKPDDVREPREKYGKRQKIRVKLADGKSCTIQHMMCTSFWHPDGTPVSAQQFIELHFGRLPDFLKNEAELRAIWSAPDTRKKLLAGLAEKGFGRDQLAKMQRS